MPFDGRKQNGNESKAHPIRPSGAGLRTAQLASYGSNDIFSYLLSAVLLVAGARAETPAIKDAEGAREIFETAWAREISSQAKTGVRNAVAEIIKQTDSKKVLCLLSPKNAAYQAVSAHDARLPKLVLYYGAFESLKDREVWLVTHSPNCLTFLYAALDPATGKVLCLWYFHDTCG